MPRFKYIEVRKNGTIKFRMNITGTPPSHQEVISRSIKAQAGPGGIVTNKTYRKEKEEIL